MQVGVGAKKTAIGLASVWKAGALYQFCTLSILHPETVDKHSPSSERPSGTCHSGHVSTCMYAHQEGFPNLSICARKHPWHKEQGKSLRVEGVTE